MWKNLSFLCSQAFRGQHEDTAENRALIFAEMSSTGNESWGIQKFELPITYGRYHNSLAKSFSRELAKEENKFSYLYKCKLPEFQSKMLPIAENYEEIQISNDNES